MYTLKSGINKTTFYKLIKDYIDYNNKIDNITEVLECDIFDTSYMNYPHSLFDTILDILFIEDGVDIIHWWIFEARLDPDLKLYDKEIEVPLDTIDDLWNYVHQFVRE